MPQSFPAISAILILGLSLLGSSGCEKSTSKSSLPTTSIGRPSQEQTKPATPKAVDASTGSAEKTADGVPPKVSDTPRTTSPEQTPAGPAPAEQVASLRPEPGPVAGNGLFVDWPKPQLLLVISGEQMGYIEPCGCAGLGNQKGGLSRRHTFLKQRAGEGWPIATLDLGNQVRRFGPQQEIKFHTTVEALKTMNYSAVAFGPDDLRLPVGEIIADAANDENGFVSANVFIKGFEEAVPKFRLIEQGGRKVAVTAVLGERAWQKVNNDELEYRPAAEALAPVVAEMNKQADFLVLLSHGTPQESIALAKRFPEFKLIVTAGGADEPPAEPTEIEETGAWLVEVGHKGMYVAAVGLYDNAEQPLRYQRVPLDKRFEASPQMHNLMVAYQGQLRDRGFEGLGLQPVAHPSGRKFVGSQVCADCHTKAFEVWSKTPHAHATQTLLDLDPPRQFDAECVSCHVTGWDPQKYFPFASGFESVEKTPLMKTNGCENCHGPGSAHVAAEMGETPADEKQLAKLREQMRLPLALAERKCVSCHDPDNSPEFNFEHYWPEVEHRGKD